MTFTYSNGHRLWYETLGSGPALTLIGGFGIVQNQFDFTEPYLTPHFKLVKWSWRGAGLSDWTMTEPYTLEQWVEDLREVLEAAGIERTSIWATSTGSAIGIRFAAKYPDRVDALVTYPWFRADQTWRDIFAATGQVARTFGLFTLARVFAGLILPRETLHNETGIDFEDFETRCFEQNINLATFDAQMAALSSIDLSGDVARISCPTMLLMGSESPLNSDQSMTSASFDSLVNSFTELHPNAEVCAVPGTGSTYCMITDPELTSSYVVPFLTRVHAKAE